MGAKNSKSANITPSPKKDAVPAEGDNHVNGDAGNKGDIIKDGNNHVTEVQEVKEIVKELAQEAANEVKEKETAKEKEIQNIEEKENTTPTKDKENENETTSPEVKSENKKVKKRFSLRSLSFLKREKRVKEDKHKNGDVTAEKKDEAVKEGEESPKVEEGQGDAPSVAEEAKATEETKVEVKEEQVEEKPAPVAVVEKAEEPVVEEPKMAEAAKADLKTEVFAGLTNAMQQMELTTETTVKEVSEFVEKKIESSELVITSSVKEVKEFINDVTTTTIENGVSENHSEEIVAK